MSTAIEALLPHRSPMRWLDALVDCTDTTATGIVKITAEHFAVVEGAMLESALIECAAQTVAAALGQRRRSTGDSGAAPQGMLAAVSNFQVTARPAVDETLTIEVREVKRLGPMLMIAARLTCENKLIATGELTLYA
jgi:predicted hotdog family 3-hydroxylacyl-ACP dehydratase